MHPDAAGALKKTAGKPSENPEADGTPKFIRLPLMIERPLRMRLSPGQAAGGGFSGVPLPEDWNQKPKSLPDNPAMVMDKAREGDAPPDHPSPRRD